MNSAIVLYYNKILKKGIIISTSYVFFATKRILKYFLFIFIVSQIVLIGISRIEYLKIKETPDIRILHINDLFDLNPLEKNFVLSD